MKRLLNKQVRKIQPSAIRTYSDWAQTYEDGIDLTIGQPNFKTPEHIKKADLTELQDTGSIAILHEDIRWLRCDIKTLNLLPNTMAKQKAVEQDAVEAILHRGNIVTEASSSNVFMIKDGVVYTHPADNYILNGITRQKIIALLGEMGIPVNEELYTVTDVIDADEVFITATKLDVVPITSIDGKIIGTGRPGILTKRLLEAMRKLTNTI